MTTASKVRARDAAVVWRRAVQGTVVFTNGVFDLLHPGHVELLEAARGEGAALVVGVNTDASVRRLGKGTGRPVVPEDARARVLAGLAAVDCVVLFEEDTPQALIDELIGRGFTKDRVERLANLEDVFIDMTGHELREGE